MPFISTNSFVGLGIEATRGTASSNIQWIPVVSPQVTPQQKFLRDEAFRGSPTTVYNHVLGVRHDEYDFKTYAYADTFPVIAKALLGTETKTGSVAPYTHLMQLTNAPSTGSQPGSVTIQDFDGDNAFQILGAQASDSKITFGAEAAVEIQSKLFGQPFTVLGSTPTASFGTVQQVPGWDISLTIGGTSSTVLVDGEININRSTTPIFTAGTSSPYRLFAGPLEVTGRMKFVVEATDPILYNGSSNGLALTDSPTAVVLTFQDSIVSTNQIIVTMTKVQFHDAKRMRDKHYVEVDANFTAEANTTDAVTGYSPIQIACKNAISTTY